MRSVWRASALFMRSLCVPQVRGLQIRHRSPSIANNYAVQFQVCPPCCPVPGAALKSHSGQCCAGQTGCEHKPARRCAAPGLLRGHESEQRGPLLEHVPALSLCCFCQCGAAGLSSLTAFRHQTSTAASAPGRGQPNVWECMCPQIHKMRTLPRTPASTVRGTGPQHEHRLG